jgi:hypothetical protein
MSVSVTDSLSNANEQIERAAKVIGRGRHRPEVFSSIYHGKRKLKSVSDLMTATGLSRVRVLQEGRELARNGLVNQRKQDGEVAYEKIDFFHAHKGTILKLAGDATKLAEYPTKRKTSSGGGVTIKISLNRKGAKIKQVTIDDIDSFEKVRKVNPDGYLPKTISETKFKKGVQKIVGQSGEFKDWGGEKNDLFTTRTKIGGVRKSVAFAFKGPGTTGKLTPGKLGKNGDQIQRLFETAGEVFLIQYWGAIEETVLKQMEQLAVAKSVMTGNKVLYGIIDGQDSRRLFDAYPTKF